MIFGWFRKTKDTNNFSEIDLGQKPVYNEEELEYKKLIDDILTKLDEIQVLIRELREEEKNGNSTGNR